MYEVTVWTNAEAPGGEWVDAIVHRGPSFTRALLAYRREVKNPRGEFVTLRWG